MSNPQSPPYPQSLSARQLALQTIGSIYKGSFADVALDRVLRRVELADAERRLLTELVYGVVRRQRTLDALIDQFANKKAHQQHPDIRIILHLGLYQLRYLEHIPAAAAVHSTVELAQKNGLTKLKPFINGLLRQYLRQSSTGDPLELPNQAATRLGILHSYPDWIINLWLNELGLSETEALCQWFNQAPSIDLRVNALRCSLEALRGDLRAVNLEVDSTTTPFFAHALRLKGSTGSIENLPGFKEGYWTVQDSSAQLVSLLLDPQPGEVIIDACAAPGGKSTHIAELMGDQGHIWACDRTASRLRKLQANSQRLGLHSIQIRQADSRYIPDFRQKADRVLLDVPCSNLGTLHRHADARWRQTPLLVKELTTLQQELLTEAATWVKPGGMLVYATCTLHPAENEENIKQFLSQQPHWQIITPPASSPTAPFATPEGWLKVWPHRHQMDGFFMVKLGRDDV